MIRIQAIQPILFCKQCNGTGDTAWGRCVRCGGSGKYN